MNIDQEVEVLWEGGRTDPSEPQGDNRERVAESSGERDLRGDVQKSDQRRGESERAGKKPQSSPRPKTDLVNPAPVQGQPMFLPGEISPYA